MKHNCKYNINDSDKLRDDHTCNLCGSVVVGYCDNGVTSEGHMDINGHDVGDYFHFCVNNACKNHIGVYCGGDCLVHFFGCRLFL